MKPKRVGLTPQQYHLPHAMSGTYTTGYHPKLNVPDLLNSMERTKRERDEANEKLLNALVDLINRSPFPIADWAETFGLPLWKLIDVCHRVDKVTDDFCQRVRAFFDHFRSNPRATWAELGEYIKKAQPVQVGPPI